jgi:outer membrane lipoprotein SlyB
MKKLRQLLVGACALLLTGLAPPGFAQPSVIHRSVGIAMHVDAFDVEQVARLTEGTTLNFSVYGTPGASAMVRIDGAADALMLREVDPGVYEGRYVLGEQDRVARDGGATATLWRGEAQASAVLDEPLVLDADMPLAAAGASVPPCADCGVIEAIHPVQIAREPGYGGAIAGGVIGAIVGQQMGHGDGRRVARILGAVGGAYVGRAIERQYAMRTEYEMVVRLPDGVSAVRRYGSAPPFRVGDRVRIAGRSVIPDPLAGH